MPNHTRAPWAIEPPDEWDTNSGPLVMGDNGKQPVCEILGPLDDEDGPHRGHYDALLIAAAPDLLAAARLFLDRGICPANWAILRAAVEKAEGKEPTDAR